LSELVNICPEDFLSVSQPQADGEDEQLGNDPLSCIVINTVLFFQVLCFEFGLKRQILFAQEQL